MYFQWNVAEKKVFGWREESSFKYIFHCLLSRDLMTDWSYNHSVMKLRKRFTMHFVKVEALVIVVMNQSEARLSLSPHHVVAQTPQCICTVSPPAKSPELNLTLPQKHTRQQCFLLIEDLQVVLFCFVAKLEAGPIPRNECLFLSPCEISSCHGNMRTRTQKDTSS